MLTMAILLGVLFIGITVVADGFGIRPTEEGGQTVVAMVAAAVFGDGTPLFVAFQAATALILFLAVNTSFNAFPRLAAILAAGRVHAPPVLLPRRPARLLLGHRRCWPRSPAR